MRQRFAYFSESLEKNVTDALKALSIHFAWSLFELENTATDRTLLIRRIIVERSLSSRLIYAGVLKVDLHLVKFQRKPPAECLSNYVISRFDFSHFSLLFPV